jgi:mannose-6-phosphate isomerase-like protein (cupin superfamily)
MAASDTSASIQPVVIKGSGAQRIHAGPMELLVIEDGSHTSGTHAVIEFTFNGPFSPPPHIHHQHEEVIYVLEGDMALPVQGEVIRLGPGDAFVTPIGLPHTFSNAGSGRLRFLLTISPASHLGYFEAISRAIREARGAVDPETTMAIMRQWGLEPVGSN